MSSLADRETRFFDEYWRRSAPAIIHGELAPIAGVPSLSGKRILICSSGLGHEPVRAAKAGAEVYMFDISPVAIENTLRAAAANQVSVQARVMTFENLLFEDNFFDVLYGSSILHHVDCARAAREVYRCLKPGGVGFFIENSARNPILRAARRLVFGVPGKNQRQRFWFFRREGTADEYPLREEEVAEFERVFGGHLRRTYRRFVFFQTLHMFGIRARWFGRLTRALDQFTVRVWPGALKYSYHQEIWMMKPS